MFYDKGSDRRLSHVMFDMRIFDENEVEQIACLKDPFIYFLSL